MTENSKRAQELNMLMAKRGDYIRHLNNELETAKADLAGFIAELEGVKAKHNEEK